MTALGVKPLIHYPENEEFLGTGPIEFIRAGVDRF
jgi:hypothetical protein